MSLDSALNIFLTVFRFLLRMAPEAAALEGVPYNFHAIHVAKGGFPYVGHPEALEAGLKPAVIIFLRVAQSISTSSM
jgi:hypothetical protein